MQIKEIVDVEKLGQMRCDTSGFANAHKPDMKQQEHLQ